MSDGLIEQGDIAIRLMRDEPDDYRLMAQWLTDPRVLEFYEGRDNPFPLERVIAKYSPRALGAEQVVPCILLYQARPIGYMQYYRLDESDAREYGLESADSLYGIDLFIGEPDCWNRGVGSRAVSAFLTYLFHGLHATQVVLDPEAWNTRAIRCYEKCGFQKIKYLPAHELHEGIVRDAWLMAINGASWHDQTRNPL
ncbi:MAG: acetyltransferase [Chloroflexi bacterium]|nr:acetyltransferase [Chloroflexota bacterium]